MTEKEKMLRGELYNGMDPDLVEERLRSEEKLIRLNRTIALLERTEILRTLLGAAGKDVNIRSPFFCDYGSNIYLEVGVFLNFNCVLLDVAPIRIGEGTQIGPAVQIYAADHPRDPETRLLGLESGKPVTIGKNVWIGGGAILLPGITVGDGAVIGAGSVVTRDVPPRATVAGNPARLLQGSSRAQRL